MKNRSKTSTRKIATAKKPAEKPIVRNRARVTTKKTVNGVAPTKKTQRKRPTGRSSAVTIDVFPKKFLAEVQQKLRPGEKLVVLSSTSAKTVYVEQ